ncbi:RDD family protein [Ehrlichia ruminantium]|uniref:RDD family protein n=1 Tax=Ehrlichia ruminantium TaxID=779 RepID=A0AAE6UIK0_EHRRU|nr:RDD family protein [Ehrlichia ruminantium]QGR02724.1 RDD family protein [Ehrlichia ruminantium]QGR03644.1 RDD family protein [Ehrlichia ruminantium]QGR04571.1 RDD family protein [Ehrlichia ruminantium]
MKKNKTTIILKRITANIIDQIILSLINYQIAWFIGEITFISFIINIVSHCCYYMYFLSSEAQASIGQKLLKIHTIRCDHKKIDTKLAFDRTLSEFLCPSIFMINIQIVNMDFNNSFITIAVFIVTTLTLILSIYWYFIALFSANNQTIHDIIFDTTVVENK